MAKTITVVTTFHKPGLDEYAQRFLDSFAERVDPRINLFVYAEDCVPQTTADNIKIFDAKHELTKLAAFKQRWQDDPKANGECPFPERRPRDYHKKFKWDAVRFANKVYAVFDACERSKDWVVWMDADSYIHSTWSYEQFLNLLPENAYITYVGRGKGSQTWPECGFYGLNLNHPVCHEFLKDFESMYEDADNGIFTLEEWHDSFVFGEILNRYRDFPAHDYSADIYATNTAKTGGGGHPLINSELGRWMDHMKGGRKNAGKSKPSDIFNNNDVEYWNTISL